MLFTWILTRSVVQPVLSEIINDYLINICRCTSPACPTITCHRKPPNFARKLMRLETNCARQKPARELSPLPDAEKSYTDQIGLIRNSYSKPRPIWRQTRGTKSPADRNKQMQPRSRVLMFQKARIEEYQRICAQTGTTSKPVRANTTHNWLYGRK